MKDKFRNINFSREKLVSKIKLNGRNYIMVLNSRVVSILRYGDAILKWNKNELEEMDRKTMKFMIIQSTIASKKWCCTVIFSRRNIGRGLIGCENSVKNLENGLEWYVKFNIEPLLVAIRTSRTVTHQLKKFKKTKDKQRRNEWTEKIYHGQFAIDIEDKDKKNT